MGFLESNSILTQYKKHSISHLQNPTSKLNNPALVKLKPNYILRFDEDILSIEYLTASLFIIALKSRILIYENHKCIKIVRIQSLNSKSSKQKSIT